MTEAWCAECESVTCTCPSRYTLVSTACGYAVRRANGDLAEFVDSDEAEKAMQRLQSGECDETEYDWLAEE